MCLVNQLKLSFPNNLWSNHQSFVRLSVTMFMQMLLLTHLFPENSWQR